MKEAYGGISNIVFLAVFLTIAMGALGLTVSYTKAFHMKNEIILAIENHEGAGCFADTPKNTSCKKEIEAKAKELTYSPSTMKCKGNDKQSGGVLGLFCYKQISHNGNKYVYRIVTQVDLSFPILERITGFKIFQVSGDTKEFHQQ